jgi:hypothetical protein
LADWGVAKCDQFDGRWRIALRSAANLAVAGKLTCELQAALVAPVAGRRVDHWSLAHRLGGRGRRKVKSFMTSPIVGDVKTDHETALVLKKKLKQF